MNPEDKYLNPRPAPQPEPPRHTASQTSLRKLADQSSAPVSRRSSWSSKSRTGPSYPGRSVKFNKLLTYARKGSAGRVSRSLSPKRTFVPRTALRRSTAPQLADTWSDPERGRRGGSSVNGTLEIGEPTLLSRTDGSRHCIPLHNTQSEFPLRLSSLSTSPILEPRLVPFELAEKLPVIGQGNLSLQPRAQPDPSSRDSSTGRGALCHPELAPGPIEYTSQRSIYELDAESPACQTRLGTLSAGESYLTYLQSPVELPLVVTPGDVSESQPFETVSDTALPQEAANPDPEYSDRLEPLAVSKKAERPQLLRSHFSAWSTSTITPEPPSIDNPADLTSPSLSSATDTTCDPLSPYRLSFQFDASANNELAADVTKTHYTNDPDTHLSNQSADDFEDLSLDSLHISPFDSKRFFDPSSFQSYSLPQEEQASSVHTPHKLPTSPFSGALPEPAIESRHGADLVRSWNDGSAHRLTATEELLNDLGYLGGMIVPN
ncbi:hypothetical protein MMC16_006337 [Acarospora aff. strigata]|nr:hypothetical protein [Acarospora aff. strigata]